MTTLIAFLFISLICSRHERTKLECWLWQMITKRQKTRKSENQLSNWTQFTAAAIKSNCNNKKWLSGLLQTKSSCSTWLSSVVWVVYGHSFHYHSFPVQLSIFMKWEVNLFTLHLHKQTRKLKRINKTHLGFLFPSGRLGWLWITESQEPHRVSMYQKQ